MEELRGVQILQSEIEKSRGRLKEFNENIKKLTGHENPPPRGRRNLGSEGQGYNEESFSGRIGRGRGRLFGLAKRGLMEDSGPPVKRRVIGGAFSRLGPAPLQRRVREDSPEEEELPKRLSVHSSVVATSREAKNRQEIMQEQTKDKEGMQRNRRMFGLLLGTLSKFKTDSKTMESKEEQRKRIDQKLEDNAEKEKKKFKQETMQLIEERHLEQTRISKLEQKMEVVQEHADREREMKKLKNFLCTKTKPIIFWKPKQMNTSAENKLKDSVKTVDEMLHASQDRLEKEIKDVMEREQKREERIKMRLREDGLFLDDEDKEKENSSRENVAGSIGGDEDELKLLNVRERSPEEAPGRRLKAKRRVVVEEHSEHSGSESEGNVKVKIENENDRNSQKKEKESVEGKKTKKKNNDSEDESDSESNSEVESNEKDKKTSGGKRSSKSKMQDDKSDEDVTTDGDENSRVVMYRETSKDRDKKKDRKDDERSEHRKHEEKRSHRHSKHSKREDEKVKDDRNDRSEKKKSKSSDRKVVEEEKIERRRSRSRNSQNLSDVEMEPNISDSK